MANESPFQVGDTVQLKSGGPKMTVITVHSGQRPNVSVDAGWFAGAKYEKANFDARALMVPPAEKPKDK